MYIEKYIQYGYLILLTSLEIYCTYFTGSGLLLRGSAGRREIWKALALSLGLRTLHLNCRELQVAGNTGHTEAKLRAVAARTKATSPCLLILENLEV
jgi:hypothetical protein